MKAFELAAGRAWAMAEEHLFTLLQIAAREGEGPEAVALRLGRPLENTRTVELHGNVAVVPLTGPMFRRANLFTEISGATSTEVFAQDFRTALEDPAVTAIVLDVSSPGGEAAGVNEVADAIHAARGVKPIVAYVGDMAASGAYWIASAADRIVMDATASVGSIGVITQYVRYPDKPGVRVTQIVSSQSPNKNLDPETDAGRAAIQKRVDAMAEVFIGAIARNRGTTPALVAERFGQGGIELGKAAVALGMADQLGSLDSVLAGLSGSPRPGLAGFVSSTAREATMADPVPPPAAPVVAPPTGIAPDQITAALIATQFPAVAAALRSEGRTEGATTERARILGIQEASLPGFEAVATAAIADGSSPETFALAQAKAQKAAGPAYLKALEGDERALPKLAADTAPPPKPPAAAAVDPSLPLADRIKAEWAASATTRAEHNDNFESYAAYRRADEAGLVRRMAKEG